MYDLNYFYDDSFNINKCLIINCQSIVLDFEFSTFQTSIFNNRQNVCGIEQCKICGYEW